MPEEDITYESRTTTTLRGTEAITIANLEKDGWQLTSMNELPLLRTQLNFRRPKPKRPWLRYALAAAALVVLFGITQLMVALGSDEDTENVPAAAPTEVAAKPTAAPTPTFTLPPDPAPTQAAPAKPAVSKLDEITAAQFLALAWEDRMTYGGSVHWIIDRISTPNKNGTWTFKIGATFNDAYGNEQTGTIEGDVGGSTNSPKILDSILYTDSGDIIEY